MHLVAKIFSLIFALIWFSCPVMVSAGQANIAVATNFKTCMRALQKDFENRTSHKLTLINGSTGKLYTQIILGAPYDIFLSADQVHINKLETAGKTVSNTRLTYAIGEIVLWSSNSDFSGEGDVLLRKANFNRLAIANPELAPYGKAAMEVLTYLKLENQVNKKIVRGENIGQTFAMVATGNAALGFVAQSQIHTRSKDYKGYHWHPPSESYQPILQDGILLSEGAQNEAAIAFMAYLKSEAGQTIIRVHGYQLPKNELVP